LPRPAASTLSPICEAACRPGMSVGAPASCDPGEPVSSGGGCAGCSWDHIFSSAPGRRVPSLGLDFLEAERATRAVPLGGGGATAASPVLEVHQDLEGLGIGGVVWDSGVALARLLGARPGLTRGRAVLDLGCGTGVAGLAAAGVGEAAMVHLSDLPDLSALARRNIAAAGPLLPCPVAFLPYSWGDAVDARALAAPYGVVICADCMYDAACLPALELALSQVAGPETTLVLAYKRRIDGRERPCFERLSQTWDLELLPRTDFVPAGAERKFNDIHLLLGRHRAPPELAPELTSASSPVSCPASPPCSTSPSGPSPHPPSSVSSDLPLPPLSGGPAVPGGPANGKGTMAFSSSHLFDSSPPPHPVVGSGGAVVVSISTPRRADPNQAAGDEQGSGHPVVPLVDLCFAALLKLAPEYDKESCQVIEELLVTETTWTRAILRAVAPAEPPSPPPLHVLQALHGLDCLPTLHRHLRNYMARNPKRAAAAIRGLDAMLRGWRPQRGVAPDLIDGLKRVLGRWIGHDMRKKDMLASSDDRLLPKHVADLVRRVLRAVESMCVLARWVLVIWQGPCNAQVGPGIGGF